MSYAWPGGARLALSVVVNVEEGAELNIQDGDRGPEPVDELGITLKKPVRNFGNETNYAYGINEGAPRVLGLLARHRVAATFTAAAVALERAPQVAAGIVAGGHEVCAHGYRWAPQLGMDETREREFIRKAAESIERSTGTRPVGWLSRYLHTGETRRLLRCHCVAAPWGIPRQCGPPSRSPGWARCTSAGRPPPGLACRHARSCRPNAGRAGARRCRSGPGGCDCWGRS